MNQSDEVDKEGHRSNSFDFFPLGLVFGFAASRGIHPFGSNPIARIKSKMPITLTLAQMDESVRCDAFMELLYRMLDFDGSRRPSASEVLDYLLTMMQPLMEAHNIEPVMPLSSIATVLSHC